MVLLNYLFYLFIEPLKLLFEFIYSIAFRLFGNAAVSIFIMSLAVNFLLLPLYFRADKLEKEQSEKKLKMAPMMSNIKKAFKGDERIMIIQAYQRINHYKPTDVFKESVSLFLQIPFFMAAYSFLNNLNMLKNSSLGPITNLGAPDALIHIGTLGINLLPILMTVINIASGLIYSKKGIIKDKIKIIAIALVFLVLLYNSPAGLVFYWTLNNIFSLCKNILVKIFGSRFGKKDADHSVKKKPYDLSKEHFVIIMLSLAVTAVLTGFMIPSDIISKNPSELINTFIENSHSPATYLIPSFLTSIGLFLIWIPLFIYLTREKTEKVMAHLIPSCTVFGLVNYIAFNKNFGHFLITVNYEFALEYSTKEIIFNVLVAILVALVVVLATLKLKKLMKFLMSIVLIGVLVLSCLNLSLINISLNSHHLYNEYDREDISVPMTASGQNVVIIMVDRMNSVYIPYLFNERPELAEKFDGFTYYPNTISYGCRTVYGAPALYGGYEYTPEALNARSDELMVDKHNEALKVLPTIFANADWNVTVADPPLANYEWISDASLYDDMENVNSFVMAGTFNDDSPLLKATGEDLEVSLNRNLLCFGLMKTMPYFIQPLVYHNGDYNYAENYSTAAGSPVTSDFIHTQVGVYGTTIADYQALEALDDVVEIREDPQNCFFMFHTNTVHNCCLLSEPDYQPSSLVDNTEYDAAHIDRFTLDGRTLHMERQSLSYSHYECAMATMLSLADWFDYLRANGLYDNTRIIIVADHGENLSQMDELIFEDLGFDAEHANPILMVKDFNSTGYSTSDEFMTNADTPYISLNGVINDPVNPFTNKPIAPYDKSGDHHIFYSDISNPEYYTGTQFNDPDGYWVSVRENIWDRNNWKAYEPG